MSAKNDDAVVNKTISYLLMYKHRLASSILVSRASNHVIKLLPLLSPIFLTLLASVSLCSLALFSPIRERFSPSRGKETLQAGSLPSKKEKGPYPPQHPYLMPNGRILIYPALA